MNLGHLLTGGQNATEGDRQCQEKNVRGFRNRKQAALPAAGRKTVDRVLVFVLPKKAIFFTIQEEQPEKIVIPEAGVLRKSGDGRLQ